MQHSKRWHGRCQLTFLRTARGTHHQGACCAPLKLLRAQHGTDGRCEVPILHTAGGLVGGDALSVDMALQPGSRALITSVAAQKVYGSAGRSIINPKGQWTEQTVDCTLADNSDLEWFPQEVIIYANALHHQSLNVNLGRNTSFFSAEIARLGRSASNETIENGCLKSELCIKRCVNKEEKWELIDRLLTNQQSFEHVHGLAHSPVLGTLVWISPSALPTEQMTGLLNNARDQRQGLEGTMRCGPLEQGFIARYVGDSTRDARFWFSRIWRLTRELRSLSHPDIPRSWPMQEQPLSMLKS